jgi:hypothetical protein
MTTQTIDISTLPITERLSIARQLDATGHAEFMGCRVINDKRASAKADALAIAPATYRLTQARLAAAPQKPEQPTATARHGAHLVEDENGKILGFYHLHQ